MPTASPAPRTKIVETTTREEIPASEEKSQGLGMPWQDYLDQLTDEDRAITTASLYRYEPRTQVGFILQSNPVEAIDEGWIQQRCGGGKFGLKIYSKTGKSAYIRDIEIAGPPKFLPNEAAPVSVAAPPAAVPAVAAPPDNSQLLALLEKTIDRLERMQENKTQPSHASDQAVEIMASAAKRAIELATPAAGKPVEDSLDRDLQRLKLLREIFMPAKAPEDEFDKRLKEAMLNRLLDPPTANKSFVEEIKGLGEIRELLGWGGEGGGKGEHWTTALIHAAPSVLDKWTEAAVARAQESENNLQRARIVAQARANMPPPQVQPGPPAAVQTSANPAPPAAAVPGGPLRMAPMGGSANAAPQAAAVAQPAAAPGSVNTEAPWYVQHVKEQVVMMVQKGEAGGAIVGYLTGANQEQFLQMLVSYPAERITEFLRNDPTLVQAVNDPNWSAVLQEARDYIKETSEEDDNEEKPLVQ